MTPYELANLLQSDFVIRITERKEGAQIVRRMMKENEMLRGALHSISLCSQNSMSSQQQCGEIARAALAKTEGV